MKHAQCPQRAYFSWSRSGSDVIMRLLSSQPSYTSSSVTSGSCSSTSDSITTTTWNTGETPQRRTRAGLPVHHVWNLTGCWLLFVCLFVVVCYCLQAETLSMPTPGVNPLLTTIAMATRVTPIHGNESESSTTWTRGDPALRGRRENWCDWFVLH